MQPRRCSCCSSAALYFFWREALPSLALLDVPLWQQIVTVDGATRSVPVTVSNVMVALAIGVVTFIAARNLPGLLEITALHRLRIEAGTRYAISAVSRYLIAIVGLIFAFRSIGFDWSQVQWIVAALGVGVGFGLQEIVANFISGLIILFERPVRVGDTVTIGNLTGTVSRIHIRATSMTDGENREIIIPNKSLITDKVINWTLTDSITRVTLKIGDRLRHGHAARPDADLGRSQGDAAGARFSRTERVLHRLRRVRPRIRSARIRAAAGPSLYGDQ